MQTYQRENRSLVSWTKWEWGGTRGRVYSGVCRNFAGYGYIHYLECSDHFIAVFTIKILQTFSLSMSSLCRLYPMNLLNKKQQTPTGILRSMKIWPTSTTKNKKINEKLFIFFFACHMNKDLKVW